jgi:hypothetical protein
MIPIIPIEYVHVSYDLLPVLLKAEGATLPFMHHKYLRREGAKGNYKYWYYIATPHQSSTKDVPKEAASAEEHKKLMGKILDENGGKLEDYHRESYKKNNKEVSEEHLKALAEEHRDALNSILNHPEGQVVYDRASGTAHFRVPVNPEFSKDQIDVVNTKGKTKTIRAVLKPGVHFKPGDPARISNFLAEKGDIFIRTADGKDHDINEPKGYTTGKDGKQEAVDWYQPGEKVDVHILHDDPERVGYKIVAGPINSAGTIGQYSIKEALLSPSVDKTDYENIENTLTQQVALNRISAENNQSKSEARKATLKENFPDTLNPDGSIAMDSNGWKMDFGYHFRNWYNSLKFNDGKDDYQSIVNKLVPPEEYLEFSTFLYEHNVKYYHAYKKAQKAWEKQKLAIAESKRTGKPIPKDTLLQLQKDLGCTTREPLSFESIALSTLGKALTIYNQISSLTTNINSAHPEHNLVQLTYAVFQAKEEGSRNNPTADEVFSRYSDIQIKNSEGCIKKAQHAFDTITIDPTILSESGKLEVNPMYTEAKKRYQTIIDKHNALLDLYKNNADKVRTWIGEHLASGDYIARDSAKFINKNKHKVSSSNLDTYAKEKENFYVNQEDNQQNLDTYGEGTDVDIEEVTAASGGGRI